MVNEPEIKSDISILYPFKHWLGTILLGPFIADFLMKNTGSLNPSEMGMVDMYRTNLILSSLLTIPTGIVYAWTIFVLNRKKISPQISKLVLTTVAALGIILTFFLLNRISHWETMWAYCICSICGGLLFRISDKTS